ncbi:MULTISPECIES: hypothetical protein [unclassified Sphingomonas]|uniref:hypothetical protein n=1 Tax=unclassified Sphingomonas TaxID=196159 RepID=UPI001F566AB1|nr:MULTISPECIES: hypothetical protein [unclassified Sphingomonas]
MRRPSLSITVSLQVTLGVLALLAMALWPPVSGAMLLVPLMQGNAGTLVTLARSSGAMLVGTGPLPGSLVVLGDRARITRKLRAWNVLLIAAPSSGCGDDRLFGASA